MICKAFKNGFCPKGQHCNYAHGDQDIRAPSFYDNDALCMMRNSPFCQNGMTNANIMGNLQNSQIIESGGENIMFLYFFNFLNFIQGRDTFY